MKRKRALLVSASMFVSCGCSNSELDDVVGASGGRGVTSGSGGQRSDAGGAGSAGRTTSVTSGTSTTGSIPPASTSSTGGASFTTGGLAAAGASLASGGVVSMSSAAGSAGVLVAFGGTVGVAGATAVSCAATDVPSVSCTDLIESTRGTWVASGEGSPSTTQSWISDRADGQAIRFDTDAAFAYRVALSLNAPMNVVSSDELHLLVRCKNESPVGWQMNVPRVTITDASGGALLLEPTTSLVPRDGVTWVALHIPLAGGAGWRATDSADLRQVVGIALDFDTWDSGFVLDLDGLAFVKTGEICAATCPSNCSGHGQCQETGVCDCAFGYQGEACATCAEGFISTTGGKCALTADGTYAEWPNAASSRNSDPWLVAHHDEIQVLRPKLLVLNFANPSMPEAVTTLVDDIVDAIKEGSRFHGYEAAAALPQLEYERLPIRDLRDGIDGRPPAPAGYAYENSTLFPRDTTSGSLRLDYAAFFSQQFAPYLGFADATEPNGYADLCKLVNEGKVHELWMVGSGDVPDAAAAEVLETKPVYGAFGSKTSAVERCAGNGCFAPEVPFCGRSLRIGFVNYARGAGCYVESQSHGIESVGSRGILPGLSDWFIPFAGFDLDRRHSLPFGSLYACAYNDLDCVKHTTSGGVRVTVQGTSYDVANFDPRCGNVHFAPMARGHYDLGNTQTVSSSCRTFGTGPLCGEDPLESLGNEAFSRYAEIAPDCQGRFLVWWLQNMPGHGSQRHLPDGTPMKSFWPYLFY